MDDAHNSHMDRKDTKETGVKSKARAKRMYRGIELPRLTAPTRIPMADIERAVANAFAKRSAALAKD